MKTIQIKNRKTIAALLIGILIVSENLMAANYLLVTTSVDYLALIILYLFIISLFIKVEVKNDRTNKRKSIQTKRKSVSKKVKK